MRKRRLGAIATYKAQVRAIRRERARGVPYVPEWTKPYEVQSPDGAWRVWAMNARGQLKLMAGPFDTRDEAQAWIGEQ